MTMATDPQPRVADSCVMVIFGATGDLTRRKLIPALYNLAREGLLPEGFAVVGFARAAMTSAEFRRQIGEALPQAAQRPLDEAAWRRLAAGLHYVSGDVADAAAYERLAAAIRAARDANRIADSCVYYLAVAPELFAPIVRHLDAAGLAREAQAGFRRLVIEKPFGRDLASARALNAELRQVLHERQIYRIDHYLGKETVQNLLVFRFANAIFEPIWNRRYIDHVQICAAETVGVERRGGYYERSGALRDMVPNHLLQLVSLTAMEPPVSFSADAVRDEQAKALAAIQPMRQEEVLTRSARGQYGEGTVDGKPVPAYRAEPNVAPDSQVETYAAVKLTLDNWRWADVPFYVRTGKRLPQRLSEISVHFRRVPFMLFRGTPVERLHTNAVVIRIQPDEGISLKFGAKIPGQAMQVGGVDMDFCYADHFGSEPATGYERLLYDCMTGDATLFQRADMIELGWAAIQPMLDVWQALPPRGFPNYAAGTWGPQEADELLARDGRHWRKIA
jgi:glucose-6-phosphate 1-dehydrogenase